MGRSKSGQRKPQCADTVRSPGRMALSLLDAASDAALLIDPKGVILAANKSLADRLGKGREELTGTLIYDLFPEDVARQRRDIANQVMKSGEPMHYTDTGANGDILETRVHPVHEESGKLMGVGVFLRDVTERRRAEEQHLRLATALEQAAEGIIIVNPSFEIEYANQTFEQLTGFSLREIKGRSAGDLYQGEKQKQQFHDVVKALLEGEVWTGRTENTRKNGSVMKAEKTISPIRRKGGHTLGYVSVWRDVTELSMLEKQFRNAQKMEAIGILAGGIAHDFNNILGPIILHSELNLELLPQDDPARHSFSEILGAAERAKGLIAQILNLSRRREHDEPIPVHLAGVLRECHKLLRPSLPTTIDIELDTRSSDDLVMADPTQIHQVIMNLCTNAARAMADRGGLMTLRVEDTVQEEPPYGRIAPMAPGEYVRLTVHDTGHGMTPEIMEKIFDPFFSTNKDGKGTGLGLAVVQSVLHRMGGSVSVESEPGRGTSFYVMLPKAPHDALNLDAAPHVARAAGGTERILLVEDEASMVVGVRTVLERRGFTVNASMNGTEALERINRSPDAFDLVISDVTMPGMTGVDLAGEILRLHPKLPVILCSGYTDLISPDQARKMGVRAFLHKPYGVEELAATIRTVLDAGDSAIETMKN